MKIFDTHSHYNDIKYNDDRDLVVDKIYKAGVDKVMLASASLFDSFEEKTLASYYNSIEDKPTFYYSVGDHPDEVPKFLPDSEDGIKHLEKLKDLCYNKGMLTARAIGEIGLDYYGDYKTAEMKKMQKEWFIAEIELARSLNLPVIIHSRDACLDTYNIIKEYGKGISGVMHCFSYELEIAKKYIELGFYLGIGGTLTFKNARKTKEVVGNVPLESLVVETDCPYLAPTPFRGTRNDSSLIPYVINEIVQLKCTNTEETAEILYKNALKLYKICE